MRDSLPFDHRAPIGFKRAGMALLCALVLAGPAVMANDFHNPNPTTTMNASGYNIQSLETNDIDRFMEAIGKISVRDIKQGWGHVVQDKGLLGGSLKINDRVFGWGLAGHADSEIRLNSAVPLKRISGFVGIESNPATLEHQSKTKAIFSIVSAAGKLWTSEPLDLNSSAQKFDVALDGQKELTLCAVADTPSKQGHINWGELCAETMDGQMVRIGASGELSLSGFLPMDFKVGDESMQDFILRCGLERRESGGEVLFTSRDPKTGLALEFTLKKEKDFPVCEWRIRFKNEGKTPTPVLHDVKSLSLGRENRGDSILLRGRGACNLDSYPFIGEIFRYSFLPVRDDVVRSSDIVFGSSGGRSSDPWLPFFNLKPPGDGGFVFAIGWSGQWRARVTQTGIEAGLEHLNTKLLPGESITLPSIYLIRYAGGELMRGNNILRRFLRERIAPQYDGKPIVPPASAGYWGGMPEPQHLERIARIVEKKIPFDVYWIDAGWFGVEKPGEPEDVMTDWGVNAGNWNFHPKRWPNGLGKVSEAVQKTSMKLLLWVEPERAIYGTRLPAEHPDCYLGEKKPGATLLLNLGNPEARDWAIQFVSGMIEKERLDVYRQDFNLEPLPYWRANDAPDRQGITEIKHIEGLYHFWGELRRRFPKLIIDNCASGGRRIDIELLRLSVPLWASDMQCQEFNPDYNQTQVSGLSHWIPFFAFGTQNEKGADIYTFRSAMAAGITVPSGGLAAATTPGSWPVPGVDYPDEWLRECLEEFHKVKDCMSGDFYQLSGEVSLSPKVWSSSEYYRPDIGRGVVFVFRRPEADYLSASIRLQGLEPGASYTIQDFDSKRSWSETGNTLMQRGIRVELPEPRSSRLFFLQKAGEPKDRILEKK